MDWANHFSSRGLNTIDYCWVYNSTGKAGTFSSFQISAL